MISNLRFYYGKNENCVYVTLSDFTVTLQYGSRLKNFTEENVQKITKIKEKLDIISNKKIPIKILIDDLKTVCRK